MTREEAIHIVKTTNDWAELRAALQELVPELSESEDEKIRKKLIHIVSSHNTPKWYGLEVKNVIAWLEKKGEQKPVEVIPIFRVGDVLRKKGKKYTFKVDRILGGYYHCDLNNGAFFPIEEQDQWELVEQKPVEWSEEDENHRKDAILAIQEYRADCIKKYGKDPAWADCVDWLKSLKDRVLPQPKSEWSKEDKKRLENLIQHLKVAYTSCSWLEDTVDWLKSLSPQKQWNVVDKEIYVKELVLAQRKDKSVPSQGYVICYDHTLTPDIYERYIMLSDVHPQKQWKPTEEQIDDAICILEKAAEHIEIPDKYKTSDWLCENEDEFIEDLHRQLRNNILMAREEAKKKI